MRKAAIDRKRLTAGPPRAAAGDFFLCGIASAEKPHSGGAAYLCASRHTAPYTVYGICHTEIGDRVRPISTSHTDAGRIRISRQAPGPHGRARARARAARGWRPGLRTRPRPRRAPSIRARGIRIVISTFGDRARNPQRPCKDESTLLALRGGGFAPGLKNSKLEEGIYWVWIYI